MFQEDSLNDTRFINNNDLYKDIDYEEVADDEEYVNDILETQQ